MNRTEFMIKEEKMKKIIVLLISIFLLLTLNAYSKTTFKVKRVIDGDTIILNNGEKVRLLGVDTPELHHPQKPVQCYAQEAKKFTEKQVLGKIVKLTFEGPKKYHYGRTLDWVCFGKNFQ